MGFEFFKCPRVAISPCPDSGLFSEVKEWSGNFGVVGDEVSIDPVKPRNWWISVGVVGVSELATPLILLGSIQSLFFPTMTPK